MSKTFRPWGIGQVMLLPPSVEEFVPEDHLAHFVRDTVCESLDLSAILDAYTEERGYPPYHPVMMTALLLYAYCQGIYSSRRIMKACQERVDFMAVTAMQQPDFRTISEFRRQHLEALGGLFVQVLRLCQKAGLVSLGHVSLDGTKVKANASKHKAMSYGRMVEKDAELTREIGAMLDRAETLDREEDARYGANRRGDELPEELQRREGRRKKIREAMAALEAEAREQAAKDAESAKARIAEREREEQRRGQRIRGKKVKVPDAAQAKPAPRAQRNFTDPDSRVQRTSSDGFIQGYTAVIAVDAQAQVIIAQHVTPQAAEVNELLPCVERIRRVLRRGPKQLLADAGYWSEENVRGLEQQRIDPYITRGRMKHGERVAPAPRGRPPANLTTEERMQRKLRTQRGRAVYARRKTIVEPVHGQIKQARGFRQFLRRGVEQVRQEWALICIAHNLLKLRQAWRPA